LFAKNSRRSQMAEGFTRTLGQEKVSVTSSGLEASHVDPMTVQVMSEIGIDISNQTSKPLSDFNPEDVRCCDFFVWLWSEFARRVGD